MSSDRRNTLSRSPTTTGSTPVSHASHFYRNEDIDGAPACSPREHTRVSCFKYQAEEHAVGALDWLKCILLSTAAYSAEVHARRHGPESLLTLDSAMDTGLARRDPHQGGSYHGLGHCHHSQGAEEASRPSPKHPSPSRPSSSSPSSFPVLSPSSSSSSSSSNPPSTSTPLSSSEPSSMRPLSRSNGTQSSNPNTQSHTPTATSITHTSSALLSHSKSSDIDPFTESFSESASPLASLVDPARAELWQQRYEQTRAFLYRTFSPTVRVGKLYIESWSNGVQRRGLDKVKESIGRGDAITLMQGTVVQAQGLWRQHMAANRQRAEESRRAEEDAGAGHGPSAGHARPAKGHEGNEGKGGRD